MSRSRDEGMGMIYWINYRMISSSRVKSARYVCSKQGSIYF